MKINLHGLKKGLDIKSYTKKNKKMISIYSVGVEDLHT